MLHNPSHTAVESQPLLRGLHGSPQDSDRLGEIYAAERSRRIARTAKANDTSATPQARRLMPAMTPSAQGALPGRPPTTAKPSNRSTMPANSSQPQPPGTRPR